MEFNEGNADEILAKINSKCQPYVCPMCKKQVNFLFGKAEAQIFNCPRKEGQLTLDGNIGFIPTVAGFCPNCGYVAQFNLAVLLLE